MDATKLTAIVSLLVALSIASERLVEIIKGLIPALNLEKPHPTTEGWRRCILHVLAVCAGILTVFLSRNAIPKELYDVTTNSGIVSLGLLASGGSGFWNAILTYVTKVKDIKAVDAEQKKRDALNGGPARPGN